MSEPSQASSAERKLLIILSNTWPYGIGENFLGDELPYLEAEFDRILVFPVNPLPVTMEQTTALGPKTRAYPAYIGQGGVTASRPKLLLQGLGKFSEPLARRELQTRGKGLKRRAVLAYVLGKSAQSLEHILQVFSAEKLLDLIREEGQGGERLRVVLYSYWYFVSAKVALDLKSYLQLELPEEQTEILAVSRAHGYDVNEAVNPGSYLPFREIYPQMLDHSYPISQTGQAIIRSYAQEVADKVSYARLGTKDDPRGQARAEAPGKQEVFQFVSCAWVNPVKRLELLVDGLARLDDWLLVQGQSRRWHWTHLGGGPGLEALTAYAKKHLRPGSYTLKGQMKQAEITEYYATEPCDLFVNVSSSEGVPVSIMEAYCFGIPALATDVGGTQEIVRPGISGHLLPPDPEVAVLTRRLGEALLRSEETKQTLRISTRRLWETLCDGEANYERFAAILAGKLPLGSTVPEQDPQPTNDESETR